jgi:hypothetical protein
MDTMSVDVATVRSTTSIASARGSAPDFLEGLGSRSQPRLLTP